MIFRALCADRGRMAMRQVWHVAAGHWTGLMEFIVPLVGIAPQPAGGTMDPCRTTSPIRGSGTETEMKKPSIEKQWWERRGTMVYGQDFGPGTAIMVMECD